MTPHPFPPAPARPSDEPEDDTLVERIAGGYAAWHEPDHDHGAADDTREQRVIPAPGTRKE